MKRLLPLIGLVGVLAFVGTGLAAIAASTSLTINGKTLSPRVVSVTGALRSSVKACIKNQRIRLYGVQRPKGRLLATTRTNAKGKYGFRVNTRRSISVYTRFAGSFYSSYGGQQVCSASMSPTIVIGPR
jgi:hypothetical protein